MYPRPVYVLRYGVPELVYIMSWNTCIWCPRILIYEVPEFNIYIISEFFTSSLRTLIYGAPEYYFIWYHRTFIQLTYKMSRNACTLCHRIIIKDEPDYYGVPEYLYIVFQNTCMVFQNTLYGVPEYLFMMSQNILCPILHYVPECFYMVS